MKTAEQILEYMFALDMLSGGVPREVVLGEIRAIQADAHDAGEITGLEVAAAMARTDEHCRVLLNALQDRIRLLKADRSIIPTAPGTPRPGDFILPGTPPPRKA